MGWSLGFSPLPVAPAQVSIPERVWGGLEHYLIGMLSDRGFVSIPERVWGGLERNRLVWGVISSKFQSLRGFGVGWSRRDGGDRPARSPCFNP